jgi:hypothetical protein
MVAHSVERIRAMLRRGLAPLTDNREALLELGFARAYPQVMKGYDAMIWERSVDLPVRQDGRRALARERAFLVR